MNSRLMAFFLCFLLAAWLDPATASGKLEGPVRISSKELGYDLQYWVYVPRGARKGGPELYVTDGQVYLSAGNMLDVLDEEIENGRIAPVNVIFIDSRDPDYPEENRRNREFMCKTEYAKFYLGELLPEISKRWTSGDPSTHRGIMGVSFGGINSACFGMLMPGVFQVLIMHSPASDKHLSVINELYRDREKNPSSIFLSHGGPQDNEAAAREFVETLKEKGYPVRHVSNDGGHDWKNWAPLLDDSLRAFAGLREEDEIK